LASWHIITPSNTQNNSKQAANNIHDLHNVPDHGIYRRHNQGKVGHRFSAQFSFRLPVSELLSQIFVLVLLCLIIDKCVCCVCLCVCVCVCVGGVRVCVLCVYLCVCVCVCICVCICILHEYGLCVFVCMYT